MLNELYRLAKTLENFKVPLEPDHLDRKPLPNGNCYRIWLDDSANVSDVELLQKNLVNTLSTFGDNQVRFPAFNIAPLYRISSDEEKSKLKNAQRCKTDVDIEILKTLCIKDNWNGNLLKKVDRCLKKFPDMQGCGVVDELLKLCQSTDAKKLRTSLERFLWEKLSAKEDIDTWLELLVRKGNSKKEPEEDVGSLSVILDLHDWEKYSNPVACETTVNLMNRVLLESAKATVVEKSSCKATDAFGAAYFEVGKIMPSVRLTSGFDVTLRAMFGEQRCQFRYGNADDQSYPITPKNRMRAQAALKWIAKPENDGIMWKKTDESAILFVCPDRLPTVSLKYAALFGAAKTDVTARFEDIAKGFIKSLDGIPPYEKPDNLHIFTLRQIPPALSKRAKIDLSHHLTVGALVEAAEDWQRGFCNTPEIDRAESITLFPLEVYKILNQVWKRDGETKKSVPQMRYYQGMEILLGIAQESQLSYHLHGLLENGEGLILYAGNQLPRGKLGEKRRSDVGKLLSLVGLLLYKLKNKKEDYMENSAFLLGQVLKISDGLHALYCEKKREGDIPPQLAGNSVLVAASENPVQALALLVTRMNPYISWAKQSKNRLAGWYLGCYEDVMTKLQAQVTANMRYTEFDKAQLFIGYLAKLPSSEDKKQPDDKIQNVHKGDGNE